MFNTRLKKLFSYKTSKFICAILSIVFLAPILLYIFSPIPIPYAGVIVSQIVEKKIGNVNININKTYLSSGTKPFNVNLNFSDIELSYQNTAKLAIPDIKIDVDIIKLLRLNYQSAITGIFFSNKSIEASFVKDKTKSQEPYIIPIKTINHHLSKNYNLLASKKVFLEDLKFNFGFSNENSILLNIKELTAYLKKKNNNISIIIDASINAGDKPIQSHFIIDTFSHNYVSMKGQFKSVHGQFIDILNNDELSKLANSFHLNLDLNLEAKAKYLDRLESLDFDLFQNDLGDFDNKKILNNKIEVKEFKFNGHCDINCKLLSINNISAILNKKIKLSGVANLKNLENFDSNLKFSNINAVEVYENWPDLYIPEVKDWLVNHLKSGYINTSNFKYNIKDRTFHFSFNVHNAKLKYLENLPNLNIHDARLDIDNKSLLIHSENASFSKNKIINLVGRINDFSSDNLKMMIEAKLNGPLRNQIYLAYAHGNIKNTFLNKISGIANTSLSFHLPLEKEINLNSLNFKLQSKLDNVTIKKIANHYYIDNGSFELDFKDLNIKANGVAYLNGKLPSNIDLFIPLEKSDEYHINVGINSPSNVFRDADVKLPTFIKDDLNIKATIDVAKNNKICKGEIDLKEASVNINSLGIVKEPGINGTIDFNLTKHDDSNFIKISNYKVSLPNLITSGNGIINVDKQQITSLKSNNTKFYKSNLQYFYDNTKDKTTLNLLGNTINLANADIFDLMKSFDTGGGEKDFVFSTDIKTINLKNDLRFENSKLKLNKKKGQELSGEFSNKEKLHLYYNSPVLSIVSSDAAKTLNAFGLYDHMDSGSLEIKGEFINKENFIGSVYITNFFIKKAPSLTKILGLNIAAMTPNSLVDIANMLNGKGIKFHNFDCPIRYSTKDKILKFDNCMANGSILKIKVSGEANLNTKYLNASGSLIQSNIFNKVFGKIPFFGRLLSGGKDEGVIFTITYNVYGYLGDDLKVKANYLSYITPGFLRALLKKKN